ncbi:hybrid sensor histidine kinase/response regulator transcription factor [Thalassotalea castellviae]|uniref:histidine kinase n=1 Tax=Thalassotalea castellviae TaxID=3075612 RepID=A0ABU2ZZQ6_9GAMM|nr:two-component regulator propeller domain-containing protein [Thalassotalea sp. W431]MDT0603415.1 two-component regulator propeller domain-containing protein [Thalassotalea sp. W431]
MKKLNSIMVLLRTFLLFFFIYSTSSGAQLLPNPNYISYNIEDGLSNSMVYTISQDDDGYMWFGTEDGLNRFDGKNFKVYRYDPTDSKSLAGNSINQVYLAPDNSLWIATHNGISQYDKKMDSFNNFSVSNGLSHNNIQSVLKVGKELWLGTDNGLNVVNLITQEVTVFPINDNGQGTSHKWIRSLAHQGNYVWIATWGGGLNRYDLRLKRFDYFRHDLHDNRSLSADTVYTVFNTAQNEIWLGTVQGGLSRFIANCQCFERLNPSQGYQLVTVPDLAEGANSLWVATNNGLSQFSFETQTFNHYSMLKPFELGNITRDIRSVFISRDGTIWLGSYQGGVLAIPANGFAIQTYQYSEQAHNSLISDDINSLMFKNGYLWTGAVGGLFRYPISDSGALGKAELVLDAFTLKIEPSSDGSFWLATNNGLYHLDAELNTISLNDHTKLIPDKAGEGAVLDVVETAQGQIFVANWRGGLTTLLDEYQGEFKQVGVNGEARGIKANSNIYALAEDLNNQLWIGTMDGVNRYDIVNDEIHHYPLQLSGNQPPVTVYYVYVEGAELYLGTSNGVYQYQTSSDTFKHYPLPLKSHYIQAIAKESQSIFWLSTFNGLYRWDKSTNQIKAFYKRDGLQSSEFNTKGVAIGDDGNLYFSGIDGVSRIRSERLLQSNFAANLKWISPVSQTIVSDTLYLELTQSKNTISLEYFVDDFFQPEQRQFRYRLNEGRWINNGNASSIQLGSLANGLYRIELQYSRDNEEWQYAQSNVQILISPPYYQSNVALAFYFLLFILMGYGYYRYRTSFLLRKKAQLQKTVNEKTAELAATLEQKNQLFANISHELRTPITLINAPIEQLAQQPNLTEQQKKLIHLAQNNGKRLFGLVERILHLSKVEQKEKQVESINIDDLLIRYVIAFNPLMQQKKIELQQQLSSNAIIEADREDLVSILENLLSNALKYTQAGGWVKLNSTLNEGNYQLSVENKHSGLTAKQIDKIFERFERLGQSDSEQGFGLGLSLVRDICRQNGWNIKCLSKTGSVIFILTIDGFCIESNQSTPAQRQIVELGANKTRASKQERQSLLIVEDNDELRGFLVDLLSRDYKVTSEDNGSKGVEAAIEQIPDLIISDVMMPELNGFSLVKALAEHDNTSHIPTILLTAKADEESELTGLEVGAVDYITKPFEARQLLLKVKNTLERQKLKFNVKQSQYEPIETIMNERDQHFIERLNQIVEQSYANNEFTVEKLVDAVAMSERQLQRKLKALFNQTPAEYIRNYRLLKAKELLLEGKSISLTSDFVGFNSSSYFSRSFKSAFGLSPKEFITKHTK